MKAARLSQAPALIKSGAQPLYVTRAAAPELLAEAGPEARLAGQGQNLVAVRFEPPTGIPATARPADVSFGDSLRLAGTELREEAVPGQAPGGIGRLVRRWLTNAPDAASPAPRRRLRLSLFWQAKDRLESDWSVSVRPTLAGEFIPAGTGIVQVDAAHPVLGLYPMSRWRPAKWCGTTTSIPLPAGQEYDGLKVIVYRQVNGGFENLGTADIPVRAILESQAIDE